MTAVQGLVVACAVGFVTSAVLAEVAASRRNPMFGGWDYRPSPWSTAASLVLYLAVASGLGALLLLLASTGP